MSINLAVIRPLSHFHLWINSLEKYSCFNSVRCIGTTQHEEVQSVELTNNVRLIQLASKPAYFIDLTRVFGGPRLTSWIYLDGLEDAVRDMDVLDSGEVFTFASRQCALLSKQMNKPLITSTIETIPNHILTRLPPYKNNIDLLAKHGDLFIAPTERSKNHLLSLSINENKIKIIRQGIDLEFFRPANSSNHKVRFLIVSVLIQRRGILELLKAFKKMIDEGDLNVELWICGDGPLMSIVNEFAQRYPIRALGRVPYNQLPLIYNDCDVFCMPGKDLYKYGIKILEDGQYTIAVLEAMASGLPVIISNSGAYPEMVGSENFIVSQGSIDELFHSMRDLARDASLRKSIGRKNRARAEKLYDAKKQLQEYYNAVQKLVN